MRRQESSPLCSMVPHGLLMQMRHHVEAIITDEARDITCLFKAAERCLPAVDIWSNLNAASSDMQSDACTYPNYTSGLIISFPTSIFPSC